MIVARIKTAVAFSGSIWTSKVFGSTEAGPVGLGKSLSAAKVVVLTLHKTNKHCICSSAGDGRESHKLDGAVEAMSLIYAQRPQLTLAPGKLRLWP